MLSKREPLFSSRDEYEGRMDKAGLTTETCAFRATNESVVLGYGFSIGTEADVREELLRYGNKPLEVVVDNSDPEIMRHRADIMCAACGMCVRITGGYTDMQRVSLSPNDRECPVFEQPQ